MSGILYNCHNGLVPCFVNVKEEFQLLAATGMKMASKARCNTDWEAECRNTEEALLLKIGAMIAILLTGILGVALPLLGKRLTFLRTDRSFFFVAKALAAGVILATGFVHILPDAMETLRSDCLPKVPWRKFPFGGFIAMLSALGTLVIDLISTGYFEKKHDHEAEESPENSDIEASGTPGTEKHKRVQVRLDIVGMHAHAASHSHSHPEGHHGKEYANGHSHLPSSLSKEDDELAHIRHIVVSQVLELGIITHSIIIGLSLGVSQSPCTIRPLLGALSFHQFFEGFALGGCISQAGFNSLSTTIMAVCFAITTPLGIGVGIGISETYNPHSPIALVVEGMFYSVSAGILVYMALVNLIAADFLSKRMRCDQRLQIFSFCSLFLGATLMSLLALWA